MSKVAIVTDSTAYIPEHLTRGFDIEVVPLQLIWGSETFRDGVDIQPDEFYTKLQSAKVMPTSSQPSPAAFAEVYQRLLETGYEVLSIHISGKLSGTMDSATQAKSNFPGQRIEVVDSGTTSMSMGFQVLSVARAAAQGASLQECKILAEKARPNTGITFVVSTLEFLRRGGRIGGAAAFLGTMLNLKPLLELRGGRIEAVEKVRTMNKAVDRMVDIVCDQIGERRPVRLACVHASAESEARLLLERTGQRFGIENPDDLVLAPVSPVIGVHTGPGCIGIAYIAG